MELLMLLVVVISFDLVVKWIKQKHQLRKYG